MEDKTFREKLASYKKNTPKSKSQKIFKRASKHAPKEISSKIPAAKIKKITFWRPDEDPSKGKYVKKPKLRDPRFEKSSGHFNQGLFEASYSFIDEYRDIELKELENAMENEKDPEMLQKLRKIYLKKKQQVQNAKDKKRETDIKRKLMKDEREKVKKGKNPFYFKRKTIKMMAMKEKIKELKEHGEYEKYMRKKRKRNISDERSQLNKLPTKRRYN